MKIFAFIGSRKEYLSNTYRLSKILLEGLKNNTKEDIEYEIYTPKMLNMGICEGCCQCFINGKCKLDSVDNFEKIKQKIEKADLILIGTPIFAHNVSADTKNLIDRLSYWLHLLKLIGKPAILTLTASGSGIDYVSSYMNKIMSMMGLHVILTVSYEINKNPNFFNDDYMERWIIKYVNQVIPYINREKNLEINNYHKSIFNSLKQAYYPLLNDMNFYNAEINYFRKNKYLECKSYEDLLLKTKH